MGGFHLFSIVSNVAVNMSVWIFFETLLSYLLALCKVANFLNHMSYIFNFLRNHQTIFHSSYTILHSHHQWKGFNFSTPLSKLILCSSHLNEYEAISHCAFWFVQWYFELSVVLFISVFLFHAFWKCDVKWIHVYNYHIFLMDWLLL